MGRKVFLMFAVTVIVVAVLLVPAVQNVVRIVIACTIWIVAVCWPFGVIMLAPNDDKGNGVAFMLLSVIFWLPGLVLANWLVEIIASPLIRPPSLF